MNAKYMVAEKLGLKLHFDDKQQLYIHEITAYLDDFATDTPAGHWLSHLIVQKLVGEGWVIEVTYFDGRCFMGARQFPHCGVDSNADTAPAATFALACKVWGIEGGMK